MERKKIAIIATKGTLDLAYLSLHMTCKEIGRPTTNHRGRQSAPFKSTRGNRDEDHPSR
jgi:hypothetical protein